MKVDGDAFYDLQLPGFFFNTLGLETNMERDVITFKLSLCKKFSFWLFSFKLLLFLNKSSYRFQNESYFEVVFGNAWDKMLIDVLNQFVSCDSLHFLKLLKISLNLRPIWYQQLHSLKNKSNLKKNCLADDLKS